ncbi:MAG: hypothetical protein ABIJ43_03415 [Candidatus Beckwithbacteria bacterium]|nr:hypothetical protein [Patescibacteria group bacterium]
MSNSLNAISNWQEAVLLAGANVLSRFFNFLPSLFGAIVIFIFGLILAKWGKALIVKILNLVKLDKLLSKSGLQPFLTKAEVKLKASIFFGEITRWLITIVFFIASVNVLGLTTVSGVLNNILGYIPSIISAVLILTAGVLLAGLVENFVKGTVNQVEPKTSRLLSKISSYLVVTVAALAAINELGIAQALINTLFIGVVATLTLGIGLSLGLGGKDIVSKILMDWYTNFQKKGK